MQFTHCENAHNGENVSPLKFTLAVVNKSPSLNDFLSVNRDLPHTVIVRTNAALIKLFISQVITQGRFQCTHKNNTENNISLNKY